MNTSLFHELLGLAPRALRPLLAGGLLLPAMLAAGAEDITQKNLPLPLDEVRIFTEVFNQIRSAYVEPIDDRTLLENAIKGMLAGIDPHSTYLNRDDYDALQEDTTGEFGGLGVEIGVEDGYIKVIAPIEGSPAERAGIQPGDLIIQLDDHPARDVTLGDTMELMRGDPGTSVTLTILREGVSEPFEVTVTREIITARSIRVRSLEPGYGYIRVSQFAAKTGQEVRDALRQLHEGSPGGLKGLVLDLRNNPGGVLQTSVEVTDAFLSQGLIVYTKGRVENSAMRFEADPEDPSQGVPLIVLINGGSASASEIVAGALQDHRRAIIMGTPSFGKGSVQTVLPLTNDRAVKLTTALYYTPSGRSIQARGIVPDINIDRGQVTRIPDNVMAYREADLTGHIEVAGEEQGDIGPGEEVQEENAPPRTSVTVTPVVEPEVLVSDYQLHEALTLLKGLNIMQPRTRPTFAQAPRAEEEEAVTE